MFEYCLPPLSPPPFWIVIYNRVVLYFCAALGWCCLDVFRFGARVVCLMLRNSASVATLAVRATRLRANAVVGTLSLLRNAPLRAQSNTGGKSSSSSSSSTSSSSSSSAKPPRTSLDLNDDSVASSPSSSSASKSTLQATPSTSTQTQQSTTKTTKMDSSTPEEEVPLLGGTSKKSVSVPSNVMPTTLAADFDRKKMSAEKFASGRSQTFMTGYSDQGFQINAIGCYGGALLFPRFFVLWDRSSLSQVTVDSLQLIFLHQPKICKRTKRANVFSKTTKVFHVAVTRHSVIAVGHW